jgi:hypothetical protein
MTLQIALTKQVVALLLVPLLVLAMVPSRGFTQAPPATGNQVHSESFRAAAPRLPFTSPRSKNFGIRVEYSCVD